ncbi:MAG: hypothetical protein PHQ27_02960 [Victivallales bacterium]|nr:hypothetical protein [Victivallales bacterium]
MNMKVIDGCRRLITGHRRAPVLAILIFEERRLGLVGKRTGDAIPRWFASESTEAEVVVWGKQLGAGRVMVLSAGETSELVVALRKGMDAEEIAAAVMAEAGRQTGLDTAGRRVCRIMPRALGGRHEMLVQWSETEVVNRWAAVCRAAHVKFLGLAGIGQLLPVLVEEQPETAWLFLQQYGGCCGWWEKGQLVLRQLPFGLPGPKQPEEAWLVRCRQRLGTLSQRRVIMLAPPSDTTAAADAATALAAALDCRIELVSFETAGPRLVNAMLRLTARHQAAYATSPPRRRDPREAGTMFCLIFIGVTLIALGLQYWQLRTGREVLKESLARSNRHKQALEQQEEEIQRLGLAIEKNNFQYRALTERKPVSASFLAVIDQLAAYRLYYTRIIRVREEKNGIAVTGESLAQNELTGFLEQMSLELYRRGLHLSSERVTGNAAGVIGFQLRATMEKDKK